MATATLVWENINVTFSGNLDAGLNPSFYDLTDIKVEEVEILGVKVAFKALPLDLQQAIYKLADEVLEDFA